MSGPDIIRIRSTEELIGQVNALCKQLMLQKKAATLAISGGTTPKPLYDAWKTNWPFANAMQIFWADERAVSYQHQDSNYGSSLKDWREKPERVTLVPMPINPEEIVAHEEEISSYCSMVGGIPQFDIVLLGMGVDGHTASLFPNTSVFYPGAGWIGYTNHPQSGQVRITMSPQLLTNARSRVFLITGKEKQTVLENAMNRDSFLPISQIFAQQNTWVITDAA